MERNQDSRAGRRTKKMIAMSLKELCRKKPLRIITINDIADYCEINRSTFYYHFADKQDVINYVYHLEVTLPLRNTFYPASAKWEELSLYSLELMYRSKDFFIQAFKISGQNDIQSFVLSEVLENWHIVTDRLVEGLGSGRHDCKALYYISDYLAYGAFSMMKTWVLGGMSEPPEKIAWLLDLAGKKGMDAYNTIIGCGSEQ